jgi:hypothetical protein
VKRSALAIAIANVEDRYAAAFAVQLMIIRKEHTRVKPLFSNSSPAWGVEHHDFVSELIGSMLPAAGELVLPLNRPPS